MRGNPWYPTFITLYLMDRGYYISALGWQWNVWRKIYFRILINPRRILVPYGLKLTCWQYEPNRTTLSSAPFYSNFSDFGILTENSYTLENPHSSVNVKTNLSLKYIHSCRFFFYKQQFKTKILQTKLSINPIYSCRKMHGFKCANKTFHQLSP